MPEPHKDRVVAALKNAFVADALAMPVHWYYNPADIYNAFPAGVKQFEDAPAYHPSSIMSLHSTQGGGRSKTSTLPEKNIVGDVILKGKRQYWKGANQHYHQGMKAGQNTLNAHCARVVLRCLADGYDRDTFLNSYIALLCSEPPAHPDTYAESFHRGFFANLVKGKPAHECAAVTHDTPSIGGLVMIGPLALSSALKGESLADIQQLSRRHLALTHPSEELARICDFYVELLYRLLHRTKDSPQEIVSEIAMRSNKLSLSELVAKQRSDIEIVGRRFSSACYISDAWPAVLYFTYRYIEDAQKALTANTNVGGDNVHRGFVLGTIMGLIEEAPVDALFGQLVDANELKAEIRRAYR